MEPSSKRPSRGADSVLWVVLTLGIAINVMGQLAGVRESITLIAGVAALICGAGLIALAVARRRS